MRVVILTTFPFFDNLCIPQLWVRHLPGKRLAAYALVGNFLPCAIHIRENLFVKPPVALEKGSPPVTVSLDVLNEHLGLLLVTLTAVNRVDVAAFRQNAHESPAVARMFRVCLMLF